MIELNSQSISLPKDSAAAVRRRMKEWDAADGVARLWRKDSTLWTGQDEHNWLGWLRIVEQQLADTGHLEHARQDAQEGGFTHALLLGMGGSSLCPEVLAKTFGPHKGFPELHVLDSTDPAQVRSAERKVDLAKTLFIVASKSGTTLEPTIFKQYFFDRVRDASGAGSPGDHFIAITDPGSRLEEEADGDNFRAIYYGMPEIGGRFSALSSFGMAPAAIMGLDTTRFLESARRMVDACRRESAARNPGVALGVALGVLANQGRNKLTLIASPGIRHLGAWLEQLIAESIGKRGKAIIPVDGEPPVVPHLYSDDRVFVYLRLESQPDRRQDAAVTKLEEAGHPVVRISIHDIYSLGQEFFRWEVATAVAGAVMGLNPFDQPDVQASKSETKKLTEAYSRDGKLPAETPFFEGDGVRLYADVYNAGTLWAIAGDEASLSDLLRAHIGRLSYRDYFAILAYIEMNEAHEAALAEIRRMVLEKKRVPTCVGFGPRFLHSTGQAYKAGPNTGVFLQITCDDAVHVGVPGESYSFGVVKAAQARGDFQVLASRGRRIIRVHVGRDVGAGLGILRHALGEALS